MSDVQFVVAIEAVCKLRRKTWQSGGYSHVIKSGSPPKSVGNWASMPYIDVQTGVKHGNPADSQEQFWESG